ncbi:MAG: hypothetical protein U5L96_16325 [Owenweeksia sp.]|nr:hypothetical protein [Owenweeksia sp.]
MNTNETIEKLKQMRLEAMAQLHSQHITSSTYGECPPDEYMALLTDHEVGAPVQIGRYTGSSNRLASAKRHL